MPTLETFRNRHAGESILVCGCGVSLKELRDPCGLTTIGVNDVGRRLTPDYLVVLNREAQFSEERFQWIRSSKARAVFTCVDLDIPHPNVIRFEAGERGGTELREDGTLPVSRNSPYAAASLAMYMGARRVGLIGVDFVADHFFGRTGPHPLVTSIWNIEREYARLGRAAARVGIDLVNLSAVSRIHSLPRMSLSEFVSQAQRGSASRCSTCVRPAKREVRPAERAARLNVVSYATTPLAGVPAILSRCISSVTDADARCVWRCNRYANGVSFAGDIEWMSDPKRARAALEAADLVVVHNGKLEANHRALVCSKPVVVLAHNYMWNVDTELVRRGSPGLVVGQYQATLREFAGWRAVPNPVPIWEDAFRPEEKPDRPTISYAPSGKHDVYPTDHKLYWHSKGYGPTMRVLDDVARRFGAKLEVVRDRQVGHAESMAMKRRSHIVIDECVTGSYHRTSLEGLSVGCVVVNGVRPKSAVARVLEQCSGSSVLPFAWADLESLGTVLETLLARGTDELAAMGRRNRAWMERYWGFREQWTRFWTPAIEAARGVEHAEH